MLAEKCRNINLKLDELTQSQHATTSQMTRQNATINSDGPLVFPTSCYLASSPKLTTVLASNIIGQFSLLFELNINGIMQYKLLWVWIFPFHIMFVKLVCDVTRRSTLYFHFCIVFQFTNIQYFVYSIVSKCWQL